MNKYIILGIIISLPIPCLSQEENRGTDDYMQAVDSNTATLPSVVGSKRASSLTPLDDSLVALPALSSFNGVPISYPYSMYGTFDDWCLHKGINASMGMSVTVGLGSDSYSGAGFSQNLAVMYATDINKRFSIAVGGYFNHLDWNGAGYKDAGFSAILGYHIDDRWDAYVYAQKSLVNPRIPRYLRYIDSNIGDRIGAMVSYKLSPSTTVSVSVETVKR